MTQRFTYKVNLKTILVEQIRQYLAEHDAKHIFGNKGFLVTEAFPFERLMNDEQDDSNTLFPAIVVSTPSHKRDFQSFSDSQEFKITPSFIANIKNNQQQNSLKELDLCTYFKISAEMLSQIESYLASKDEDERFIVAQRQFYLEASVVQIETWELNSSSAAELASLLEIYLQFMSVEAQKRLSTGNFMPQDSQELNPIDEILACLKANDIEISEGGLMSIDDGSLVYGAMLTFTLFYPVYQIVFNLESQHKIAEIEVELKLA